MFMKNASDLMKAATILAFIFVLSLTAGAQEKKFSKMSGGMGHFMAGYSFNNYSGINELFKANGFPELKEGAFSIGGGGWAINNNIIIGGEGFGLSESVVKNSDYQIATSTGYGFFNLGYMLVKKPKFFAYPMLGIGGGETILAITKLENSPVAFQDVLDNAGRESYLKAGGFLMNFSIGANYLLLGGSSDSGSGGMLAGLRVGYMFDPDPNDWKFNDEKLTGSPDSGISCFYVKLTIGGGGYVIK